MSKLPNIYILLSVFSGIPLGPVAALKKSGLWADDDHAPISDYLRGLLRILAKDSRIRWVTWGPDSPGYVLTGLGEAALDVYHTCYGPANAPRQGPNLADVLKQRAAAASEQAEGVAG